MNYIIFSKMSYGVKYYLCKIPFVISLTLIFLTMYTFFTKYLQPNFIKVINQMNKFLEFMVLQPDWHFRVFDHNSFNVVIVAMQFYRPWCCQTLHLRKKIHSPFTLISLKNKMKKIALHRLLMPI